MEAECPILLHCRETDCTSVVRNNARQRGAGVERQIDHSANGPPGQRFLTKEYLLAVNITQIDAVSISFRRVAALGFVTVLEVEGVQAVEVLVERVAVGIFRCQ